MRISDWSSDVCSSDLAGEIELHRSIALAARYCALRRGVDRQAEHVGPRIMADHVEIIFAAHHSIGIDVGIENGLARIIGSCEHVPERGDDHRAAAHQDRRSEEHTSELQSLMRNSYAVFCLKKTNTHTQRQQS